MRLLSRSPLILLLFLASGATACGDSPTAPVGPEPPINQPAAPAPHPDAALFLEAARHAWAFVDRHYRPETGLVDPVEGWEFATVWDMGSGLAALYSAHRLGLIAAADYDLRMRAALRTLLTMPLVDGIAPNRNYSTATAQMVGAFVEGGAEPTTLGTGWSPTDIGRLLTWLGIVAHNQSRFAAEATAIVNRFDYSEMIRDGYLQGSDRERSGTLRRYQEGRIGYEQYAAYGFALWGKRADLALALPPNSIPISIFGVPLFADRRGNEHLTSEPFILQGLELGWTTELRDLAINVLRVQEERHRATGLMTIVSEDAVPDPPFYFYYYVISFHGRPFVVLGPESFEERDEPRWVSAKAAFAWHALLPSEYTRLAVAAVAPAAVPGMGWGAGVREGSGAPTGGLNLNTAAVILEAALHSVSGRPLIHGP
jgi:hypothetical protein